MSNNSRIEIRDGRKFNFTMVENDLLEKDDLDVYEKLIYIVMCKFAGSKEKCFPSRKTLAKYVGCSVKTIDRKIDSLLERGFVEKVNRKRDRGDYTSNIYIIKGVASESRQGGRDTESPPLASESRHGGVRESLELDLNELDLSTNKTLCAANGTQSFSNQPPFKKIINFLNEKTGRNFKAGTKNTRKLIRELYSLDYELDDFKKVIEKMANVWGESEYWKGYLRPKTLFKPDNFEDYLNSSEKSLKLRYKKLEKQKNSKAKELHDPDYLKQHGWN